MDREDKEIAEELISGLPAALVGWYPFEGKKRQALIVASAERMAPFRDLLEEKGLRIETEELTPGSDKLPGDFALREKTDGSFDYIMVFAALEFLNKPKELLQRLKSVLRPGGRLLLGVNNRLGIRYFCGDRDCYTRRNFDGIEDYVRAYSKEEDRFRGRMYDRSQLEEMLDETGFGTRRFYSVYPTLEAPTHIFGEDYTPQEVLKDRLFPIYTYPDSVFLEQERLWKELIDNGLFHKLANAYLIECAAEPEAVLSDVMHVTTTLERGKKDALYTVIRRDSVEKIAAFAEGKTRLSDLISHGKELKKKNIPVVEAELREGRYVMPLVRAKSGQRYLEELLESGDGEAFYRALDRIRDEILSSSEVYEGVYVPPVDPHWYDQNKAQKQQKKDTIKTKLFRKAYIDMVPLNAFYEDGSFVFYDQEFCVEDFPVNAVLWRVITTFYSGIQSLKPLVTVDEALKRYGLYEQRELWGKFASFYINELKSVHYLSEYHRRVKPDGRVINANRQRMNFSSEDYQRLFVDIFDMTEGRKLVLFGTGKFAKQFMDLYGEDYPPAFVVDNRREHWGTEFCGIPVRPPEVLKELGHGQFKVIICIKNYISVMDQLESMGIREYSIFDAGKAYPRLRKAIKDPLESSSVGEERKKAEKKKYHVGYIAGVFDLYHVGHLNMFRNAKKLCDYLIVGVVSDEGVRKFKRTDPFVPFEERIDMVRSCRYVDEVQEIPLMFSSTTDAWKLYHFDVQFSGSDYVDNPDWLREKEFLEKHGATMHFFPYTQSTSSTQLKSLIEKRLL